MKNIKLIIYLLTTLILNNAAIAKTWLFDIYKITIGNNVAQGTWTTKSSKLWRYRGLRIQEWKKEYENDNFSIQPSRLRELEHYGNYNIFRLNGTFDVVMKSFIAEDLDKKLMLNFRNNNITIKKNLNLFSTRSSEIEGININIGGTFTLSDYTSAYVKNRMVINAIDCESTSTFLFNTKNGGTLENPALTVITPIDNSISLRIFPLLNQNIYIKLGGIGSNADLGISNAIRPDIMKLTPKKIVYINLNTKEHCYASSDFGENLDGWNQSAKMAIIKEGTAEQSFTTDHAGFSGGVKMLNGTLRINFNQNAKKYYYLVDGSKDYIEHILPGNQRVAHYRTTATHGDLEMYGGTFGSTEDSFSYGAFRFTNIVYTSGAINLRLAGPDKMDSIDLGSYYVRYNKHLERELYKIIEEKIKGGKISLTKNAKKFYFKFDGDLSWLISDVSADLKINNGKGAKVISWDNGNGARLSKDNFAANLFKSKNGKMYKPDFTVGNNGLYVKYVPVPEISQITAIIGALALTFAAIRKRKGKN